MNAKDLVAALLSVGRLVATCAAVCCELASAANTPSTPTPVRLVANNHTTYQGTTAPRTIDYFGQISVDSRGLATFYAVHNTYTYAGTQDSSVWSERDGTGLKEIVHSGDLHPPAIAPYHFSVAQTQNPITAEDTFAFRDEFPDSPSPSGLGVWISAPGQGFRLVATNKPDPEIIGPRTTTDGGVGLFYTNVTSQGYIGLNEYRNFVYLASPDNTLRLVASEFAPVPGVSGSTFRDVGDERVNDSGQIAWDGTINLGGSVNVLNSLGIWKQLSPGSNSLVVRQGGVAPGTPNLQFNRFLNFSLNNDGSVAFSASLLSSDASIDVGIWRDKPGQGIQPVLVEGDPAPGTAAGVTFGNIDRFMRTPYYDPSGNMVIASNLTGPGIDSSNDSGLWMYNGQNLRLVAREGEQAPGTEPGVVFNVIDGNQYAVNRNGQVAFIASLRGPGIDSTNSAGIWAEGPQGLTLIARCGDYYVDGNNNVFRMGGLSFSSRGLSSNGYVGFWAYDFGDSTRSAAYVSSLVAIPEPSSFAIAVVCICACLMISRTRRPKGNGI